MKSRFSVAILMIAGMSMNLAMVSPGVRDAVDEDESARVLGGGSGGCYNQGSAFYICTSNSSCDPTVIPPVTGLATFFNLGSQTNACYNGQYGYATCPCGNTKYGPFDATGGSSCYNPID
jgi:hypothetical protein